MFDALHEAQTLKTLYLPRDKVDDTCVIALCELINSNTSLKAVGNVNPTETHGISLKGLEGLAENLQGNISLNELRLNVKTEDGQSCFDLLKEIATKTSINILTIPDGAVSPLEKQELQELLLIPIDVREIPILSTSKSAAKSQRA